MDAVYLYNNGSKSLLASTASEEHPIVYHKLALKLGECGDMELKLLSSDSNLDAIKPLVSEISFERNGDELFRGEAVIPENDGSMADAITVKGALNYLGRVLVPPHNYRGTIDGYVRYIVGVYNNGVDQYHKIQPGVIRLNNYDDTESVQKWSNEYEYALDLLKDRLVNTLGGYLRVRVVNGTKYLDYINTTENVSNQTVEYGKNLISTAQNVDYQDVYSVFIPLGAEVQKNTEEDSNTEKKGVNTKLTIASVNNGSIYLIDQTALSKYGRREKVLQFDDVTIPYYLKQIAQVSMAQYTTPVRNITIKAVDEAVYNANASSWNLGDSVSCPIPIYSKTTGKVEYEHVEMVLTERDIYALSPEDEILAFGTIKSTLADRITGSVNRLKRRSEALQTALDEAEERRKQLEEEAERKRQEMQDSIDEIEADVDIIEGDIDEIESDVELIEGDIVEIEGDIDDLEKDVASITKNYEAFKQEFDTFKKNAEGMLGSTKGYYKTTQTVNGATVTYMHDEPKLADSTNIWKFTADSIACSIDGGKTYPFGMTVDGQLVQKYITSDYISSLSISAGAIKSGTMSCDRLDGGTIRGQEFVSVYSSSDASSKLRIHSGKYTDCGGRTTLGGKTYYNMFQEQLGILTFLASKTKADVCTDDINALYGEFSSRFDGTGFYYYDSAKAKNLISFDVINGLALELAATFKEIMCTKLNGVAISNYAKTSDIPSLSGYAKTSDIAKTLYSTGKDLPSTNLNNVKTPGVYAMPSSGLTNSPLSSVGGTLIVMVVGTTGNIIRQIIHPAGSTGNVYIRNISGSTVNDWYKIEGVKA